MDEQEETIKGTAMSGDWFWPWTLFVWFVVMPALLSVFPVHVQPAPLCDSGPFVCLFFNMDWLVAQTVLNGWMPVLIGTAIYALPLYVWRQRGLAS